MAEIAVTRLSDGHFAVVVREGRSQTTHEVTVRAADTLRLGDAVTTEVLIEESFRFLLEREPKEAVLGRFDLSVIGRYFPEYPAEIRRRLAPRQGAPRSS